MLPQYLFSTLKKIVTRLLFFAALMGSPNVFASKIDSLSLVLQNAKTKPEQRVTALLALGTEEQKCDSIHLSVRCYMEAIRLADSIHDSIKLYQAYQRNAQLHGIYLRFDKSIEYKTKALKLSEAMGNSHYIADAKMNIGIEFYSQKNYGEAIQQFQSALDYCKGKEEQLLRGTITYLIALCYLKLSNTVQAAHYFSLAYPIIQVSHNTTRLMDCYVGMSEMELAKGNTDTAIVLLEKVVQMTDSILPGTGSTEKGFLLANAYLKKGDLAKAEEYGLCSMDYYSMPGTSKYDLAEVTLVMANVYEAKGDYAKALQYRKKYQIINDSVTSSGNQYKINTLLSGFKLEKQNQQIELLRRDQEIQHLWKIALEIGTLLLVIIALLIFKNFTVQREARKKSDHLLLNILPEEVADELKLNGFAKAQEFDNVTVLFSDFKNFTQMSEKCTAQELVDELNACFTNFDNILQKYGIEKIKTVGDAYLAVSGLPTPDVHHAFNMASAAIEIRDFMLQRKRMLGDRTFEVRIGMNSGSVVAGIVGVNKFAYDIWGDTVNIAARMEQTSEAGKINISESTYAEIKPFALCTYRGMVEAKNKGEVKMYYLNALSAPSLS